MNKIYITTSTGFASVDAGGATAFTKQAAIFGRTLLVAAVFLDDGSPPQPMELANGSTGILIAKRQGDPLGGALLFNSAWVKQQAASGGYIFTTIINDPPGSFAISSLLSAATPTVSLDCEIVYSQDQVNYFSTPKFTLQVTLGEYQPAEAAIEAPNQMFPLPTYIARTDGSGNVLLGDGTKFRLAVVGTSVKLQKSGDGGLTWGTDLQVWN